MASLSEMLQTGLALNAIKQQNSSGGQLANLLNSSIEGFQSGRQMAMQQRAAQVEQAYKLAEMQKNLSESNKLASEMRMNDNVMKMLGIKDLAPAESDNAESTHFDSLGGGTPPAPDNSSKGKLAQLFQNSSNPRSSYSTRIKIGPLTLTERDPGQTNPNRVPKDPSADNARVMALAKDAARREKFNLARGIAPAGTADNQLVKYGAVEPTLDEQMKYVPFFAASQAGDTAKAQKIQDQIRQDTTTRMQAGKMLQEASTSNPSSWLEGGGDKEFQTTLQGIRDSIARGGSVQDALNAIADAAMKTTNTGQRSALGQVGKKLKSLQGGQ